MVAELLCLALVLFWPVQDQNDTKPLNFSEDEVVNIQAPVRTVQESSPPPPPSPQVPVPVPNDEPVEEEEIEFNEKLFSDTGDSLTISPGEGGQGDDPVSGNPEVGPSVISIEEPTFENDSPGKADIYVRFLVNRKGRVEEAEVEKILKYDNNDEPTILATSLEEPDVIKKTIDAALNWRFRPARENGETVRAYTTQIFIVDY